MKDPSCSTGGCGGPGMCPGIALLVAGIVGFGITALTGSALFGWIVGLPLGIALIFGLPQRLLAKVRGN